MKPVHVGCSGWQYADWRERFYPKGLPQRRWLEHYARHFDTVEVNATFYRLAKPESVAQWIEQTPPHFRFAVKGSRYLTHMKRLRDTEQGPQRFFDSIAPLVESPKLGPILWQLPPNFKRDDERLDAWLEGLKRWPPRMHAIEFRDASWFAPDVYGILHAHDAALVIGDDPRRIEWPLVMTTDWTFIRFHHGRRGRRGNYSRRELEEWAERLRGLADQGEVWAYFNNDFARGYLNAVELMGLVGAAPYGDQDRLEALVRWARRSRRGREGSPPSMG